MESIDFPDAVNILKSRRNFNDISSSRWELVLSDPIFKKTWIKRCSENESTEDDVFPIDVALDELEMIVCDLRKYKVPYKATSEEFTKDIIDLKLMVINLKRQIKGMEIINESLKELTIN